jgi:hypothetical protein
MVLVGGGGGHAKDQFFSKAGDSYPTIFFLGKCNKGLAFLEAA